MGQLQLVGSLKSQVSYAKYSLFYRALLQNRPIILRRLLIVGTLEYTSLSAQCATLGQVYPHVHINLTGQKPVWKGGVPHLLAQTETMEEEW